MANPANKTVAVRKGMLFIVMTAVTALNLACFSLVLVLARPLWQEINAVIGAALGIHLPWIGIVPCPQQACPPCPRQKTLPRMLRLSVGVSTRV